MTVKKSENRSLGSIWAHYSRSDKALSFGIANDTNLADGGKEATILGIVTKVVHEDYFRY